MRDASPNGWGNNSLGANDGTGYPLNPATGQPYTPQTAGATTAVVAGKPFLGICRGGQLMVDRSFEDGEHEGLGLIAGDVVRFRLSNGYTASGKLTGGGNIQLHAPANNCQ